MSTSDPIEHVDVLIVGAGLSGIGAAHYVKRDCPWASFVILEARDAIGGTWDLFRYPGVRSDSDMFTLGYAFRPWDGEETIADGSSIRNYIRQTAKHSDVEDRIRFGHRVMKAEWSSAEARWHVTAERTDTGEKVELTAGFYFACSGYYRYDRGYQPEWPGMERFGGQVVHPQFWPEDLDYADKRVIVIGSGATAVTLVPALAEKAAHVTMLQRSPSYIAAVPAGNPLPGLMRRILPADKAGRATRWLLALITQAMFQISRRWPGFVRRQLIKGVKAQLPDDYDVDTHFSPRYNPWDQRLCVVPNGDLFAAVKDGRAEVVTDHIASFTEAGLGLVSGRQLDADIIVTATGLELVFAGGVQLRVDGQEVELGDKLTYKGMMLEGVPNLALAVGYTNASWTLKCDLTCQYVTRLLNHLHETGLRQCTPVNTDADVVALPLLGLSSGYVLRSADQFPKQGNKFPWQVHQSYLRDWRVLQRRGIHDEAMVFSNPRPGAESPAPGSSNGVATPSSELEGSVA